ncbi:uncharacterized protein LOC132611714 [Lycium barbarum]|uniref:uncharacterized protein LOC132611714 n=1 Tax=Lycium barbarum TaxID=112863 RepID=UPI00293EDE81|nr:uncharacterized protein LOC132611714 [Lycium barbarum]
MSIDPDSSPGPDGLNGKFFQATWEIISNDLVNPIQSFFSGGVFLPKFFSHTCLVMIPKVEHSQQFSDLRPISLCNVTSKIISKIINSKMGPLLPKLISPNQSGFIKGKMISENILLAQEILNDMGKPNKGGNMVIKLDMAKAYDKVSWPYLYAVMKRLGFNDHWVNLILKFISNNWYSLVLNGGRFGFFKSENGLRQGDLISPSLFVISAEPLSILLNKLHDDPNFRNFYMNKRGPNINHLCFADDVILFTSGNRKSLKRIMRTLESYEAASGQQINKHKSTIILHSKASSRRVDRASRITGMKKESLPFKYLSCPLYTGRKRISYYTEMIHKILTRIRGWNYKLLSPGGKSTLIKHVLQAMPSHLLAVLQPPKGVFKIIELELNRFFWSDTDGAKRYHWSSWDNMAFPFTEGGTNFRSLGDVSKAFTAKQWWRFRTVESLWSIFLNAKYSHKSHPVKVKWRAGPLYKLILPDFSPKNICLKDILVDGVWHWDLCPGVHDQVKIFIQNMDIIIQDFNDKPIWKLSNNGSFSVGSAWNLLRHSRAENSFISKVWHKALPFKMSFVSWRILLRKISTDDNIQKFDIRSNLKCHCCRIPVPESTQHLFVNGTLALAAWKHFGSLMGISGIFRTLQEAFNSWWSVVPNNPISVLLIRICPIVVVWELWRTRCSSRFGKKKYFLPKLLHQIGQTILMIIRLQFLNFKYDLSWEELIQLLDKKIVFKFCRIVYWNKPASNFFKLNSDGTLRNESCGGGGVIRDAQGKMIMAYSIHFNNGTSNNAEAKALLFGIQWCIQHNITNIELETDSILLLSWVKQIFKIPWQIEGTIRDIRRHLEGATWSIQHCYREANKVSDLLAAMSHNHRGIKIFSYFEDLSTQIRGHINLDMCGTPNFRIRNKKFKDITFNDVEKRGIGFIEGPNSSEEEGIKEQDWLLPIANVGRIMKQILPQNAKFSKEAKETMQECVSEFIRPERRRFRDIEEIFA